MAPTNTGTTTTVRLEWNYSALATVRTGGPVVALATQLGRQYQAKANATLKSGSGYGLGLHVGPGAYNRFIANVYTLSGEAVRSNAANQTLAKLLSS